MRTSFRLVDQLSDLYPHSFHVRDVGLIGHSDEEIWHYSAMEHCAIATKDVDFYQRSMLRGAPPQVIWVRIGNATTRAMADVLRTRFRSVQYFIPILYGRIRRGVSRARAGRPIIARV